MVGRILHTLHFDFISFSFNVGEVPFSLCEDPLSSSQMVRCSCLFSEPKCHRAADES